MHAAPMYIAETSPSQIRGRMISLKEFSTVIGMVVSSQRLYRYQKFIAPFLKLQNETDTYNFFEGRLWDR